MSEAIVFFLACLMCNVLISRDTPVHQIDRAIEVCKTNDGLKEISAEFNGVIHASCKNNATFRLQRVQ